MQKKARNPDGTQEVVNLDELRELIEAWVSSESGGEQLVVSQATARAATDFVDTEIAIKPAALHQSVTL